MLQDESEVQSVAVCDAHVEADLVLQSRRVTGRSRPAVCAARNITVVSEFLIRNPLSIMFV
jgi:hypothetical protein